MWWWMYDFDYIETSKWNQKTTEFLLEIREAFHLISFSVCVIEVEVEMCEMCNGMYDS